MACHSFYIFCYLCAGLCKRAWPVIHLICFVTCAQVRMNLHGLSFIFTNITCAQVRMNLHGLSSIESLQAIEEEAGPSEEVCLCEKEFCMQDSEVHCKKRTVARLSVLPLPSFDHELNKSFYCPCQRGLAWSRENLHRATQASVYGQSCGQSKHLQWARAQTRCYMICTRSCTCTCTCTNVSVRTCIFTLKDAYTHKYLHIHTHIIHLPTGQGCKDGGRSRSFSLRGCPYGG